MEAETYPLRLKRFPFLGWFDGTVVSGREGVAKPEPALYTRLLERFGLKPRMALMIDDMEENLEAAGKLGMQTALFLSSRQLRAELEAAGNSSPMSHCRRERTTIRPSALLAVPADRRKAAPHVTRPAPKGARPRKWRGLRMQSLAVGPVRTARRR